MRLNAWMCLTQSRLPKLGALSWAVIIVVNRSPESLRFPCFSSFSSYVHGIRYRISGEYAVNVNADRADLKQVHTLVLSHRDRSCLEFNKTEHKENGVRKLIPLLILEISTNVLGLNQLVEDLELQMVSQ